MTGYNWTLVTKWKILLNLSSMAFLKHNLEDFSNSTVKYIEMYSILHFMGSKIYNIFASLFYSCSGSGLKLNSSGQNLHLFLPLPSETSMSLRSLGPYWCCKHSLWFKLSEEICFLPLSSDKIKTSNLILYISGW